MAAYTSAQSGPWTDPDTWGAADYPDTGDTATISADHEVEIEAADAISCGAITVTAGSGGRTKLIINGTLDLEGAVTLNAVTGIDMGPDSTLDLNGNNITASGADVTYDFIGTSASRVTIQSTGSAGAFLIPGTQKVIPDWQYVDASGLAGSRIGRTHTTSAGFVSFQYCTFTACGYLEFDGTGTGTNAGFLVANCDFRNPTTPASDHYPMIYQTNSIGTQQKTVRDCTWSDDVSGADASAFVWFRCLGATIKNCVFHNFLIRSQDSATETAKNILRDCVIYNDVGGDMVPGTYAGFREVTNCYFMYDDGDHPFANPSGSSKMTVRGCVFEGTEVGLNWFLQLNSAMDFYKNIMLGLGNTFGFTANGTSLDLDVKGNTFFIENSGQTGSGIYFAPILLTEQTASNLAGTCSITDNLCLDPDSTDTRDRMIDLLGSTADQIDTLNYNVGWSWPGGDPDPDVQYGSNVDVTSGVGTNDSAVDPDFVDRTRGFAAWDTSLGGAGTYANAIAELLKLNASDYDSNYTPRAAVRYVFGGFKTQASGLRNNAQDGGAHGAANFHKSTRSVATIRSAVDYVGRQYA